MARGTRIAVVGLGTAGSSAALLLSRAGFRVTLFEKVEEPQAIGAGIMLQVTGLSVLRELGLEGRILEQGARIERLRVETTRGKNVLQLDYRRLREGLFGLGIHRGVLFDTLYNEVRGSEIDLRLGVEIVRARHRGTGDLDLLDRSGASFGPFDLVVVCDGARSRVRTQSPAFSEKTTKYPWGALWFVAEDQEGTFRDELFQRVDGTRGMVGILPTGLDPSGKRVVSLFVSLCLEELPALRSRGIEALRQEILRVSPAAESLLPQLDSFDELRIAEYFDVSMPRWNAPGIVAIGDAAHATSPQLGQGANLALVDAKVLADCLRENLDVEAALRRYSILRADHLNYYQFATRFLTPFFQSTFAPLGLLRDWAMPVALKIPYAEREMIRSMAGTKTGYFSGDLFDGATPP